MHQTIIKKINLFKSEDIQKITKIVEGYSNNCFMIELKNQKKYFYREAIERIQTPRKQEAYIAKLVNDETIIWYDKITGNMLRTWINGVTNFEWHQPEIVKFVEKVKKLHHLKYDKTKIIKHDNYIKPGILNDIMAKKYNELIIKYQNLPLFFCHNDLNPGNILLGEDNKIHLFDYEWSRINSVYWDLANFSRETLNETQMLFLIKTYKNLDKAIFKDFLFITSCFALYWASLQDQNEEKITSYIKHLYQRLEVINKITFEE